MGGVETALTLGTMAEESARIAQRCQEAKSVGELMLDHCGLMKFPDAVFFLLNGVELTKVSYSHNQLQKIPAKLCLKFSTITSELRAPPPPPPVNQGT